MALFLLVILTVCSFSASLGVSIPLAFIISLENACFAIHLFIIIFFTERSIKRKHLGFCQLGREGNIKLDVKVSKLIRALVER